MSSKVFNIISKKILVFISTKYVNVYNMYTFEELTLKLEPKLGSTTKKAVNTSQQIFRQIRWFCLVKIGNIGQLVTAD